MNDGIEYRVYTLERDGHVASVKMIRCAGDRDAILHAREMRDGHAVELWCGIKFLGRFEPQNR